MIFRAFYRSCPQWREVFLTFQAIILSDASNVIRSPVVQTSPYVPPVWKFLQISPLSPSVSSFWAKSTLSSTTTTRTQSHSNSNSNQEKITTHKRNLQIMSGQRDPAKESMGKSLPENLSIHTANITEVHNVPMKVLIRPFPSVLDEAKVLSLMATIENPDTEDQVPPIDIMWITGRAGGDYFYSFGGCHRYEAYKRLHRETIPCKLFKSSIENLRPYLGASTPDLL